MILKMAENTPRILVLCDVNTTSGGTLYEASRAMVDSLVIDHQTRAVMQPYALPGRPHTQEEWLRAGMATMRDYDALVTMGGIFNVPDSFYVDGKAPPPRTDVDWRPEDKRFEIESALLQACFKTDKPVLGICGGMQVMAGLMGGKLGLVEGHHVRGAFHKISIVEGSRLAKALGQTNALINTRHREAVVQRSPDFAVTARCKEDGVIEAIEIGGQSFAIGVQGHPENMLKEPESPWPRLVGAFVQATRKRLLRSYARSGPCC